MTDPTPTPVPTPPVPTPPVPAPPVPDAQPSVWEDPAAAKAEIERLRKENGAARTNAKAQAAEEARKELAAELAKILNLNAPETDPAKLADSLTEATKAQAEAKRAQVELAVFRNAGRAGGDPDALLDSTSFLKTLDGIDSHDAAAVEAAIKEAVSTNPRLGAAGGIRVPAPNPAQGTSGAGPVGATQLSRQDVERLAADGKHTEIEKARVEGRLDKLLGIKT